MSLLPRLFGRGARRPAPAAPVASTPSESKTSRTGPLIAFTQVGRPVWTPRDYSALAREGFQQNAIVHRCVRMIAEAAASVPLLLFEGERELTEHPILALIARPNPRDGRAAFLEALFGHLLLAGNAYVEQVAVEGEPRELYVLRPDRMKVVPGPDGWPEAWDYTVSSRTARFARLPDGPGVVQPILHLTLFHPLDDHYGLSPVEAAAAALDVHNAASAWNKALLDNAARPSGALVYLSGNGVPLSDEQVDRLKGELEASFQGAANAGRPLLLEGGLDWKPLSMSPKDMDFAESRAAAAREIALAFGVPPMMLGLPGDNTFANYAEANRSFWRQTVLPLAARTAESLAHWLAPLGERRAPGAVRPAPWPAVPALRLVPDLDRIDALSAEREALWRRIGAADFLTTDEKRAAVGYGSEGGGGGRGRAGSFAKGGWAGPDPVAGDLVPNPGGGTETFGSPGSSGSSGSGEDHWRNQPRVPAGNPDGGQWTSEGGGGFSGGSGQDTLADGSGQDTLAGGAGNDGWGTPGSDRSNDQLRASLDHLQSAAGQHPSGNCAKFVRQAIEAGGIPVRVPAPRPGNRAASAADFGPSLIAAGAWVVADVQGRDVGAKPAGFPPQGYEATPGDVIIFPTFPGHPHGHMAMWNGEKWISDFVQRDAWPNQTRAKIFGPSYRVYRFQSLVRSNIDK